MIRCKIYDWHLPYNAPHVALQLVGVVGNTVFNRRHISGHDALWSVVRHS